LPTWKGLAEAELKDLQSTKLLNFSKIEQLKTLDPKKQLSIAKLIAEENRDRSARVLAIRLANRTKKGMEILSGVAEKLLE
jgi:hypothetical protein